MQRRTIPFAEIKASEEIRVYIRQADNTMKALGYTEHSFAHVTKCAETASELLISLGYDPHTAELARIAGYMHDIGNAVNRADHAQSGAIMAFNILNNMQMNSEDIAVIISAIGHHDEHSAAAVDPVAAALILADKSDVRRSRVRNRDTISFDIHDRVNFAVEESELKLDKESESVVLRLSINTEICAVMDYFEIFLERMLLCRKAADYFGLHFKLVINGQNLL